MKNNDYRIKRLVVLALGLTIVLLVGGCSSKKTSGEELSYQQVISYMSNSGIIEDHQKWQQVLDQTKNGKSIKSVQELGDYLYQGNKHSSVAASVEDYDEVRYPTTTNYGKLKVINIPAFSSERQKQVNRYIYTLNQQINARSKDDSIILNFGNNRGGDPQAMLAGLCQLLPNGTLFTEVARNGEKYQFTKNKQTIADHRSHESTKLPSTKRLYFKKIYVLTNTSTASAAEFSIIALKQNRQTVAVGYPTGGYTTTNKMFKIKHTNEVANLTNGTVISDTAIGGRTKFNNDSIKPDITTLYQPMAPLTAKATDDSQKLDPDFVQELKKIVK